MKKLDIFDLNYNENELTQSVINLIKKTANMHPLFKQNISEINLQITDIKKYRSLVIASALSYEEHQKNKTKPIKKLVRTNEFNTLELEDIYEYIINKKENEEIILLGIDQNVWKKSDFSIKKTFRRKAFLQYAVNCIATSKYQNFILLGPPNTGKTFLATQFLKNIKNSKKQETIAFINWNIWISTWRLTFSQINPTTNNNSKIYNTLLAVHHLFIDDFAIPRPSEWEREAVFFPLLKQRKQSNLHTGLISNLSLEELQKRINPNWNNIDEANKSSILNDFKVFALA